MREINSLECSITSGAGLIGEAVKLVVGEGALAGASYLYGLAGVAGNNPPANENDNGGTSRYIQHFRQPVWGHVGHVGH